MGFNEVDSVEGYDTAAMILTESWVQKLTNASLPSTSATRSNEINNEGNVPDDESEYAECVSTHPGSDAVGAGSNNWGPSASAGVPNGDRGLGDGSSTVLSFIPLSGLLSSVEDSSSHFSSDDDDGSDEFQDCDQEDSAEGQGPSAPSSSDESSSSEESHPGGSGSESGHEADDERSKATSLRASSHEGNPTSEKVDLDNEVKRELAKLVREDDWIQVAGAVTRVFAHTPRPRMVNPFTAILSYIRVARRLSFIFSRPSAAASQFDPVANEEILWDPHYDDTVFVGLVSLVRYDILDPFSILLDKTFVVTLTANPAKIHSFCLLQEIFIAIARVNPPNPGLEREELEALSTTLDLWVPKIVQAIQTYGVTLGLQKHLQAIGGLLCLESDDKDGLSRVYDRVIAMIKSLATVAFESDGVEDVRSLNRVLDSIALRFDFDGSDDIDWLLSSPPSSPAANGLREGPDDSGFLSNTELSATKKRKRDAEEDTEGEGTSQVQRTRIEGYATEAMEATETVGKGRRRREEDDQEGAGVGTKRPRMM